MSPFHLTYQRLDEWGRAARIHDPLHLAPGEDAPIHLPAYDLYSPFGERDEAWGDPTPPEALPDPIDEAAVAEIDIILANRVCRHHRNIIKEWFWRLRRKYITEDDCNAAVRAVADLLYDASRRVA